MLRNKEDSPEGGGSSSPSKIFLGVRFVLIGFDNPTQQAKVRSKLINGGGVDVGGYSSRCTHLIVDRIVYDDSECVVARADGKVVVTAPWVDDCLDVGMLVDTSSILYRPVKDLNGIPGSKSLSICLTGYQRQDREDIMRMVGLMGAYFSKPLVANKVTHLICYKHEGEKYELAKKLKKIKLVNHCWLEDCLKAWEILPECSYSKSGYELEIMEAEAKDSEEEAEDRNNEQYKENVAGSPYNLHTVYGMGTKGLEMPVLMNQNVAKENLAARAEDIVNGKRLVSPAKKTRSDHVPELQQEKKSGVAFICQGTGSYEGTNASKKSSELSSNPTTSKGTPQSNAAAPVSLSYSRKTPGRSPLSKVSGMLSSPAVSYGVEQYKATNGFDVSPTKLVQYKDNLDSVENQNLSKDIELHLEGGNTYKLPQKRKASLSSSSSKSPREVSANLEPCGPGSPSMSARTGKLQNGAFQINSSSCYGNGDNFDKNDIQNVASSHYGNLSDGKSISENKLTNPGMHFSMTLSSDGTEFSSDFKMLERSPKISDVGLEHSKNTFEASFSGKDLSRVMDFQFDENGGPQEECQSIMASSLKSENCEAGKARSPVDLSVHSGSKNETFARSLPKKTVVKKSLGSKSKLSSARNKQKGSLCFNSKSDVIFPMEESTGQEHGRAVGGKAEIDRPAFDAEPVFKRMVTKTLSSENKVKNVDEAEDEETEAPDEGIGAELENSAREEVVKLIPQENEAIKKKSEVTNSEANETKIVKLTPEKDEGEVVKGDTCKSIATVHGTNADPKQIVGGSKLKKKSRVTHSAANETKSVTVTPEKGELDVVKGDICKSVATVHVTNADSNQIVGRSKIKKKSGVTHSAEKETTSVTMTPEKDEREVGKEDICMSVATVNGTNADPNQIVGASKIKEKSRVTHSEANETNSVTMTLEKAEREVVKGDTCRNVATVHGTNADSKQIVGSSKIKKKSRVTHIAVNETKNLIATPEKDEREVVMGYTCKSVATVHGANIDPKRIVRGSRVVKSEPVWFILTGHRLQRKEFQQMIKRLKGRVCRDSHNWSYQATHSIIPDPIKRTEKFFAAAASGRWILKTDYLIASNRAGNFLPEEPYEWFKNGFNEDGAINLEAPRKWRLLREKTGHGAFYGMNIIIYGDCFAPSLDTLKRVVKAGDGAILATSPPYTRFLKSGVDFAVVSPSMPSVDKWVQEFLRHEIPCVVADYLVEYVCKPGCSLERHVLYKTHAWAEKSFANLISLSNEVVEDMIPIKDDERMDLCCKKCGSFDRAEVMLICGDETGSLGCGIGTHIDCCDPPLEAVPDEDWFCPNCREGKNSTYPTKMIKKRSSTKKRK